MLDTIAAAHPAGDLDGIGDNRASHKSPPIQGWLAEHPRVQQVVIPTGAWWLNVQAAGWRLLRRAAFAGQPVVDGMEIAQATTVATQQRNARATPWVWGRPPPPPRTHCRRFLYRL